MLLAVAASGLLLESLLGFSSGTNLMPVPAIPFQSLLLHLGHCRLSIRLQDSLLVPAELDVRCKPPRSIGVLCGFGRQHRHRKALGIVVVAAHGCGRLVVMSLSREEGVEAEHGHESVFPKQSQMSVGATSPMHTHPAPISMRDAADIVCLHLRCRR